MMESGCLIVRSARQGSWGRGDVPVLSGRSLAMPRSWQRICLRGNAYNGTILEVDIANVMHKVVGSEGTNEGESGGCSRF